MLFYISCDITAHGILALYVLVGFKCENERLSLSVGGLTLRTQQSSEYQLAKETHRRSSIHYPFISRNQITQYKHGRHLKVCVLYLIQLFKCTFSILMFHFMGRFGLV